MSDKTNPRQITVYNSGRNLLEAIDNLQAAPISEASAIHSSFSKIRIQAFTYSDPAKKALSGHNLDPSLALYIAELSASGKLQEGFRDDKLNIHKKRDDGKVAYSTLQIVYKATGSDGKSSRNPWQITVKNGWAVPEKMESGGYKPSRNGYEADKDENTGAPKEITVYMADKSFQLFWLSVRKYVQYFEQTTLPGLLKARNIAEEAARKEAKEKAASA